MNRYEFIFWVVTVVGSFWAFSSMVIVFLDYRIVRMCSLFTKDVLDEYHDEIMYAITNRILQSLEVNSIVYSPAESQQEAGKQDSEKP